jgi:hypothetical protein
MQALQDHRLAAFAGLGAAMLAIEWGVTRTAAFTHGRVVPVAVLFDLVVVLPLLFVLVVLRPSRRPVFAATPVLALGGTFAGLLLAGHPGMKGLLQVSGAVVEVAMVVLLVRRLRGAARQFGSTAGDDLLVRIGALTDPVLRVLGAELAVVHYAFAGPFLRPRRTEHEFAYTAESGAGGLLLGVGMLILFEGIAVHFLLAAWSPRVAWIHAGLGAYSLLWLAAAYQAARLRPVVLTPDRLLVRTSLLWAAAVPRAAIVSVTPVDGVARERETLRAAFGTAPNLLLSLSEPVKARGLLGLERTVSRIALHVDEPARLARALFRE